MQFWLFKNSSALNNSVGFLCIRKFIGDDVTFTEMNKIIMIPVNLEIKSEALINENIKSHLAVYLYFFNNIYFIITMQ